jgi:hypothetical protein
MQKHNLHSVHYCCPMLHKMDWTDKSQALISMKICSWVLKLSNADNSTWQTENRHNFVFSFGGGHAHTMSKSFWPVFLLSKGFLQNSQTHYLHNLEYLQKYIYWRRPNLEIDKWILHYNNVFYTALLVKQFLAKKQIPMLEHSLHSPDLARCDLYMYLKFKISLKGSDFEFQQCFQTQKRYWNVHIKQNK